MARSRLIQRTRELTWPDIGLACYVGACLILGGASAAGAVANGLLQLAGLVLLVLVVTRPAHGQPVLPAGLARLLLAGLGLVVAVQFLPLPPALWGALPGRARIVADYRLLGMSPPWLTLSLMSDRAIGSALALIPFLTALALAMRSTGAGRVAAAWVAVAVASLSIAVGAVQLFSGGASRLYLYAVTNRGDAVGFFANKNHLATLFLMTLPFIAAMAARDEQSGRKHAQRRRPLYLASFAFLAFGTVLNNSSAGLALLVPCIAASALIYLRGIGRPVPRRLVAAGVCVLAAGLLLVSVGPFHGRFLDKAISTGNPATRGTSMGLTARAARDFLPMGSGLGSFRRVYTAYENVATVGRDYVNHAHNDWLEIMLETGILGLALLIGFCVWLLTRGIALWSGDSRPGSLARAASASLVLLLLHSLVDYPARTGAVLALAGLAVGIVAVPKPIARTRREARDDDNEEGAADAPSARTFVAD